MGQSIDTPIVFINLDREEYSQFRDSISDHERLPLKYEDWLAESLRTEAVYQGSGLTTRRVMVDFEGFAEYARGIDAQPSFEQLTAYAVARQPPASRPEGVRSPAAIELQFLD